MHKITKYIAMIFSCVWLSAVAQDLDNLIASNDNVIIEFMRPACPFSQYLNPLFNEIMNHYGNKSIVFKVIDISSNPGYYKSHFGFGTVPTVIYYKKGKKLKMHDSYNMSIKRSDLQNHIETFYNIKARG